MEEATTQEPEWPFKTSQERLDRALEIGIKGGRLATGKYYLSPDTENDSLCGAESDSQTMTE